MRTSRGRDASNGWDDGVYRVEVYSLEHVYRLSMIRLDGSIVMTMSALELKAAMHSIVTLRTISGCETRG